MRSCLFALAAGLCWSAAAAAQSSPGLTFTTANTTADGDYTLGWRFTTNNAVTVTALGYYDQGQNGLTESHAVALYDGSGNMLTSASVPSGTAAALTGDFRYVNLSSPIVLPAGQTFTVAGTTTASETYAYGGDQTTGLAFDPSLAPASPSAFFEPGSTLTFPQQPAPNNYRFYAGPNLMLAPVPEPASVLVVALGGLGLIAVRRRLGARSR